MEDAVELADLIWKLRSELTRAMDSGEDKDLRFRAESVELELTVAVEKVKDAKIGMRFWVLDASRDAKNTAGSTQKIKLVLHPVRAGSPDAPALISDGAVRGER